MLRILNKHLTNERAWLRTESLGAIDKKYHESARMAKERIPQLEAAIKLIVDSQCPIPNTKKEVGSRQLAVGKASNKKRVTSNQLNIFK